MKRFLILLAAVCCTLPMAAQWGRRPTPNDTLKSTRVLPDGKVLFQIYAPEAKTVSVSGDLPWNAPVKFEKAENGVWKGVCEGLGDGVFRYNFNVDGVRVQDPKAPLSAEQSSLLTVGESYVKDVPHGAVAQRFYFSKTLGEMRRLHVWTPAGYEKSNAKLPVLYLIHGGGDNDASWPGVGAAGWILDNLLAAGKMVPMIVVMPNGTINVPNEVPPFAEDMFTSIIPFVQANYNVKTDAGSRAVAGLSMGGMETMEGCFTHPELDHVVADDAVLLGRQMTGGAVGDYAAFIQVMVRLFPEAVGLFVIVAAHAGVVRGRVRVHADENQHQGDAQRQTAQDGSPDDVLFLHVVGRPFAKSLSNLRKKSRIVKPI